MESSLLLRALEQSASIIIITDKDGKIEYVNSKFIQVTGYELRDVLGKTPRILKSGEQPPEVYKNLWRTIISGTEWHGEFHNKKKNGELFWVSSCIGAVKNKAGAITHYIDAQEDITEEKKVKNELERMNKLMIDRELKMVELKDEIAQLKKRLGEA